MRNGSPNFFFVASMLLSTATIVSLAGCERSEFATVECKEPVTAVMKLAEGADPAAVAIRNNLVLIGKVGTLENYYEYRIGCADGFVGGHPAAADAVASARKRAAPDPDVHWEMIQKKKLHSPRIDDYARRAEIDAAGYVPRQWHLTDYDDGNAATAHVLGAWRLGRFGKGAKVAVVDDGLDVSHADIERGCDKVASANYDSGGGTDPSPRRGESHGTGAGAVASASGAAYPPGTPVCGHGVAPLSTLIGVRLIAEPVSDSDEAKALSHRSDEVAVYSCSWGPSDDGETLEGPGTLAALAIADSAENGRGGLGSVFAWAAGNGGGSQSLDSCAFDGYASDPHVVAVTAVTHLGNVASYSERCPAVFVSAPSSGDGWRITTADVRGRSGSSTGDCNDSFGGTSAAAPLVAGIFALVFEADPELSARDAMRVVAATARQIDESDESWRRNAAGVWHSDRFGFGVADAEAAVVVAETWRRDFVTASGEAPENLELVDVRPDADVSLPKTVPDDGPNGGVSIRFRVDSNFVVERAVVTLSARHARRGELVATLTSPGGSTSQFGPRPRDFESTFDEWKFSSVAHWNEMSIGTWTLSLCDSVAGNGGSGTLIDARLSVYGREATNWDVVDI